MLSGIKKLHMLHGPSLVTTFLQIYVNLYVDFDKRFEITVLKIDLHCITLNNFSTHFAGNLYQNYFYTQSKLVVQSNVRNACARD